jgi:hypothetical protein
MGRVWVRFREKTTRYPLPMRVAVRWLLLAALAGCERPTPPHVRWGRALEVARAEGNQTAELALWRERLSWTGATDPEAVVGYSRALDRSGQPEVALRTVLGALSRLGEDSLLRKEEARLEARLGLRLEPGSQGQVPPGAWLELARLRLSMEHADGALDAVLQVLAVLPDDPEAWEVALQAARQGASLAPGERLRGLRVLDAAQGLSPSQRAELDALEGAGVQVP